MKRPASEMLGLLLTALLIALASAAAFVWQPTAIRWPEPSAARWQWAAATVLIYGVATALLLWRRRPQPVVAAGEGSLLVVHASQTGHAEQLAQQTVAALCAAGVAAERLPLAALDTQRLQRQTRLLLVVSTTGEGDAPDSAFGFVAGPMRAQPALATLRYGVLALGDRRYPHYCGFGHALAAWLQQCGAAPLFPLIEVDDGDARALQQWQQALAALGGSSMSTAWAGAQPSQWRLLSRRVLNPGSPAAAMHHLALAPMDGLEHWQAGDIAEVFLPQRSGEAPQRRDYSIASLPAAGRLELMVREHRDADGRPGRGSGWLCRQAVIGEPLHLRIRSNPGFHLPEEDRPLILIGSGTGLAGLRALLLARAAAARTRNWMIYGERSPDHEAAIAAELTSWHQNGALSRLDLAWSRELSRPRYVQHCLLEAGDTLRAWVAEGAAIYVCGSAQGMAPAVDETLRSLLGGDTVNTLRESGLYRRDVY